MKSGIADNQHYSKSPTALIEQPKPRRNTESKSKLPLTQRASDQLTKYGNNTIPDYLLPELIHDSIVKQIVERTVAGIIFFATLPIMAIIFLKIKLSSEGPALFFQERVGLGGKTFRFVKFRTMYVDAKARFPELYAYHYDGDELNTLKFKIKDDPRVTPEGVWLRKSSLDELPNFWNVMVGTMSLIGPRPDIPEMVQYYEGDMLEKFAVRPGVTGMAQAYGRGDLGFLETVELDVQYARQKSWLLDIKLFFLTVYKVLIRDGAF